MFALISGAELAQLRGDLAAAEQQLADARKELAIQRGENVRLDGWNRSLAGKVRWHEQFLRDLPTEVLHPLETIRVVRADCAQKVRLLRADNAQLRGRASQLELSLRARPPIPLEPVPAPVAEPEWDGEDTLSMELDRAMRLGSSAWATQRQIADLQHIRAAS